MTTKCPHCGENISLEINKQPGYETWRLPRFIDTYGMTKGQLMEFYDGVSIDSAIPQDWLNDFASSVPVQYDLARIGICWGYSKGDSIGVPLPLFIEADHWLTKYKTIVARRIRLGKTT